MASDKALYICTAVTCVLIFVIGCAITGGLLIVATEMNEQTRFVSNQVIPVAADLDGDGKMNDLVFSYAGQLGFNIANQTRINELGYWSNDESRSSYMKNRVIRSSVNKSS
jgi:hypothetical protein